MLKNKIRYIFLNLDKNLREKEKENWIIYWKNFEFIFIIYLN
jgi:hypothetical protein